MNTKSLEYFIKVVENGSFTKAAEELFISQSAISQQIKSLEEELGYPLMIRNKKGFELTQAEVKPQVLQAERHPYYTGKSDEEVLKRNDIKVMSWYPLGHGDANLLNEEIFIKLGEKYNKTPAQIIMKWHVQKGFIVIPGSKNVDHIKDNFNIFDFELTSDEMDKINELDIEKRYYEQDDSKLAGYAMWQPQYEVE